MEREINVLAYLGHRQVKPMDRAKHQGSTYIRNDLQYLQYDRRPSNGARMMVSVIEQLLPTVSGTLEFACAAVGSSCRWFA